MTKLAGIFFIFIAYNMLFPYLKELYVFGYHIIDLFS